MPESGSKPSITADKAIEPPQPEREAIVIRGARQNNLKNLSLDIPTNELIVVTGVSGSVSYTHLTLPTILRV